MQQRPERANGIDLGQLPKSVFASIESDVRDALRFGKTIDPAAFLRKADFEAVGIKPTRGQIPVTRRSTPESGTFRRKALTLPEELPSRLLP